MGIIGQQDHTGKRKMRIKELIHNKRFVFLLRLILGSVFIYASIDKIFHPDDFAEILYNYKLLPDTLIYVPALFLPWVELIAGSFLIAGVCPRGSSFIINSLLILFIAAISVNLIRGLDFDCGCFTTAAGDSSDSAILLLIRDILLLIPGLT